MPLVTSQGYDLVGNPLGAAMSGYEQGARIKEYQRQQKDREEKIVLRAKIQAGGPDAYESYNKLAAIDPQAASEMVKYHQDQYTAADESQKAVIHKDAMDSLEILHAPPSARKDMITAKMSMAQKLGMPTDKYQYMLDLHDKDPKAFEGQLATTASIGEVSGVFGNQDQTAAERNLAAYNNASPQDKAVLGQMLGIGEHAGKDPRLVGAPSGSMWNDPNDPAKGVTAIPGTDNKKLKQIPVRAIQGNQKNNQSLRDIDDALKELDAYPKAFGLSNALGDTVKQRTDPKGVAARAALTKISAIEIHDKAGSAQGVQEVARLKPYVPSTSDDPATIRKKLNKMRQEFVDQDQEFKDTYNEDYGYISPNNGQASPGQTTHTISQADFDAKVQSVFGGDEDKARKSLQDNNIVIQ